VNLVKDVVQILFVYLLELHKLLPNVVREATHVKNVAMERVVIASALHWGSVSTKKPILQIPVLMGSFARLMINVLKPVVPGLSGIALTLMTNAMWVFVQNLHKHASSNPRIMVQCATWGGVLPVSAALDVGKGILASLEIRLLHAAKRVINVAIVRCWNVAYLSANRVNVVLLLIQSRLI
jgi:hypothetical protein